MGTHLVPWLMQLSSSAACLLFNAWVDASIGDNETSDIVLVVYLFDKLPDQSVDSEQHRRFQPYIYQYCYI